MGLPDILLLVALDQQLVQHDQIVAGQWLDRLKAQRLDRLALLVDLHQPSSAPDAVDPLRILRAADIQVYLSGPLLHFPFVDTRGAIVSARSVAA